MALGMSTVCKAALPRTKVDGLQWSSLVLQGATLQRCNRAEGGRKEKAVAGIVAFLPSHATSACRHMHMPRSCKAPLGTYRTNGSVDSACTMDLVLIHP